MNLTDYRTAYLAAYIVTFFACFIIFLLLFINYGYSELMISNVHISMYQD